MCKRAKAWICIQYIWVSFFACRMGWKDLGCFFHLILITLGQTFWHMGFQAVLVCMLNLRWILRFSWGWLCLRHCRVVKRKVCNIYNGCLPFTSGRLWKQQQPTFPGLFSWSWHGVRCCVAGFAPGQGAGAGAEQSQTLSTPVMTGHHRLALLPCSQCLSLTWIFHLSISFMLEATYVLLSSNWVECCNSNSWAMIPVGSSGRTLLMVFSYLLNCL